MGRRTRSTRRESSNTPVLRRTSDFVLAVPVSDNRVIEAVRPPSDVAPTWAPTTRAGVFPSPARKTLPLNGRPQALIGRAAAYQPRAIGATRLASSALCLSRSQRKEVLFAKNIAGNSGRSPGPYRYTKNSKIKC